MDDSSKLISELKDVLNIESSEVVKLTPLSTDGRSNENALRPIPGEILEKLIDAISQVESPIIVLGRGTKLHDHLLWLTACCLDTEIIHWDSKESYWHENPRKNLIPTEISQDTLASFLTLKVEAEISGSSETEWFGAQDLAGIGGAVRSGVNSALQTAFSNGLIEKLDAERVVYRLTSKGWPIALESWSKKRNKSKDIDPIKRLLISFGRIPGVNVTDKETGQGSRKPFNMIQYLNALQPYDGFIAVLQRHEPSIEGTHVITLDEALVKFESESFIGDLRYASEILRRRTDEEYSYSGNHLLVLNPKANSDTDLMFFNSIFASIMAFEKEYRPHNWTIDMTAPMNGLSPSASIFAYMSNSEVCYMMKNRSGISPSGVMVEESPFSIIAHRLTLPDKLALEVMSGIKGNKRNIMIAMLLYEDAHSAAKNIDVGDTFEFSDDFFSSDDEEKITFDEGVSWNKLELFNESLMTPEKNIKLGNKSTNLNPLINSNLITTVGKTDSGSKTFTLTSYGRFVAAWLKSKAALEAGS
jgi:hypothetical protein